MNETALAEAIDLIASRSVPVVPTSSNEAAERVEAELDRLDLLWTELTDELAEFESAGVDATEADSADIEESSVPESGFPVTRSSRAGTLLSVVIPVYNEKQTVLDVIESVRNLPLETEVIVVDDGSTDDTAGWLETLRGTPGLRIVLKPHNEGKGAALRTGFAVAQGDIVIVQDADLEYDPRDIPSLVQPLLDGDADAVFGSRFLAANSSGSAPHRWLNCLLTAASNAMTGLRLTDMETCYKAFRRSVLTNVKLRQSRFGFEPEMTAKLARLKYHVLERPIRYRPRSYSEGKKIGVRDLFNAIYCIIRYRWAD